MRTVVRLSGFFIAMLSVFAFCVPASADLDEVLARQPAGPAFDCKAPKKTAIETLICKSPQLGKLDLELSDAYAGDAVLSDDAEGVIQAEGAWLDETRNRCATVACLTQAYDAHIASLEAQSKRNEAERAKRGRFAAAFKANPALIASLAHSVGVKNTCLSVDGRIDPGDGNASLMAHICGPCSAPASTIAFVIFHRENATYRKVLQADECYVSGLFDGFQTVRTHGLFRIATFSRSSCCDHQRDFYDYDGRVYRHSATLDYRGVGANLSHTEITLIPDSN